MEGQWRGEAHNGQNVIWGKTALVKHTELRSQYLPPRTSVTPTQADSVDEELMTQLEPIVR